MDIRSIQEDYFRNIYMDNMDSTMAVSSESMNHKHLRFKKISTIFEKDDDFSLHDVGMGIADFKKFLLRDYPDKNIIYSGSDILPEYCDKAKATFPSDTFYLRDISEAVPPDHYDYVILSGVFHQKRNIHIPMWEKFLEKMISSAFSICKKGIAFNVISPFVDYYQPEVYYCNLPKLLFFINDSMSRFFSIFHDYALFEITIFVYKEEFIQKKYPENEFVKYFKTS
jgi:hypothetical protein